MRSILFSVCALLTTAAPLLCADSQWSDSNPSLDYMSGYSISLWLSQNYNGEDREAFIRGVREGLEKRELNDEQLQKMDQARATWFNEDQRSEQDQLAYASGFLYGSPPPIEIELNRFDFMVGYIDTQLNPYPSFLNRGYAMGLIKKHQALMGAKYKKELMRVTKENDQAGKDFLRTNANKPGIVSLENGMQYKILVEGAAEQPSPGDTLLLNIETKKLDGHVVYDSKTTPTGPVEIRISSMIPAWRGVLAEMTPGSVWEFYVPANLAMGDLGWQDKIQPGEALIYRLELLEAKESSTE